MNGRGDFNEKTLFLLICLIFTLLNDSVKSVFGPSAQLQFIITNTPKVGDDRILISGAGFSPPGLKLSFSPPNPNTRPPLLVGVLLTFITRWLLRCNDAICNSGKYSQSSYLVARQQAHNLISSAVKNGNTPEPHLCEWGVGNWNVAMYVWL